MQRLLHEGMDAGLCGFSIQRLGPNSVQADFDGSPMVTDTMVDEDILAPGRGARPSVTRASIQITQADRDSLQGDYAFVEQLAEVAQRPILYNVVAPTRHKRRGAPQGRCAGSTSAAAKGLPIFAQCATGRAGLRLHARALEPVRRLAGVARRHDRHARPRSSRRCRIPELRQALVDEAEEADRRLRAIQAGVGGNPARLIVQGVQPHADLQQYVGRSVGEIAESRGQAPDRGDARPVAGRRPQRRVPRSRPRLERRVHGRDDDARRTRSPACPTAAPTRSSSPAAPTAPTSSRGSCATRARSRWRRPTTGSRTSPPRPPASRTAASCARARRPTSLVYDLEELAIDPPWIGESSTTCPGGEWRRVQRAKGYQQIIVNGEVTFEDGELHRRHARTAAAPRASKLTAAPACFASPGAVVGSSSHALLQPMRRESGVS